MVAVLLDRPMSRSAASDDRGRARLERPADQRPTHGAPRAGEHAVRTLDERVVAAWEGLLDDMLIECPVCRGKMLLRGGAVAGDGGSSEMFAGTAGFGGPTGTRAGDCLDCGTALD